MDEKPLEPSETIRKWPVMHCRILESGHPRAGSAAYQEGTLSLRRSPCKVNQKVLEPRNYSTPSRRRFGAAAEKFQAWTDNHGNPEDALAIDAMLDNISLYWF